MNFNLLWKVSTFLIVIGVSGCFGSSEDIKSFISADPLEFETYRQECIKRPSPPARTTQKLGTTNVYITYCQPAVKGRKIWGDLVKFNEIWRTGANETTVLSTSGDVLINGDTLFAGNYGLYTIPGVKNWVVVLNKEYDTWGAYNYDEAKDVLRFTVETQKIKNFAEQMTFEISTVGVVNFSWENLGFDFYITPI